MWPLAVNAQSFDVSESRTSSASPTVLYNAPFSSSRSSQPFAYPAACADGAGAFVLPKQHNASCSSNSRRVSARNVFSQSQREMLLPVFSSQSKEAEQRPSFWAYYATRLRCFYFSPLCQKLLACINILTLFFLVFLLLVDASTGISSYIFSTRDAADRFMLYFDALFTFTLSLEIALRCAVLRLRTSFGLRASLAWALIFDALVFLVSVAALVALVYFPLSSSSRTFCPFSFLTSRCLHTCPGSPLEYSGCLSLSADPHLWFVHCRRNGTQRHVSSSYCS